MHRVIISGIGTEIPQATISNDELVESFNMWVEWENIARRANGKVLLEPSDAEFVVYASGVKARPLPNTIVTKPVPWPVAVIA